MSSYLFGQRKLDAPLGLTFGTNMATVKSIFNTKGGLHLSDEKTDVGIDVNYRQIRVGTLDTYVSSYRFVNDKLFEVLFTFDPLNNNHIQSKYNEICDVIIGKYGKGKSTRDFKYPYNDGDNDMQIAIERNYTQIKTIWTTFADGGDLILAIISGGETCRVLLNYRSGKFNEEAKKREILKNNSEF